MTFLEDLGWWGVALALAVAVIALIVLIVATVGGVRQARRAAETERAGTTPDADDEATGGEATAANGEATAANGEATAANGETTASDAAASESTAATNASDPLRELQLRYARGEIERDEYLQRRADLEGR